jgi:hypothetical protein
MQGKIALQWPMGNLFPDSEEFPDYKPMPRFRLGLNGPIIPLAIAGATFGLCPINIEEHGHAPHENHNPISYRAPAFAVSTSSAANMTVPVPSGSLATTGHAPTVLMAPWIKAL